MTFRNQLGSVTALSLATNPATPIVAATVAGVAITVAAAVFTYKAYKECEEKKHREAIEEINRLHKRFLERIVLSEYNEIQGFPPIFKLTPGKDSTAVESMHMTDDEVNDIGKNLPHGTDIALSNYREAILNAILKLKDYYFSRKERNDLTAGVVSYLLYILQTKCLNFEGYDYDIAYLKAITKFINAYASQKNRENTQHFSRLNPVFSYLTTALQALEKHQEALSLEEIVGELRDSSLSHSSQLIHCFAQLCVEAKYWDMIKNATMDELQQGILRKEYIRTELGGLIFSKDAEKELDDSPLKKWIMYLADYYIQTLNIESKLTTKDVPVPDALFKLPDFNHYDYLLKNKSTLTANESTELHELDAVFKAYGKYFEKYSNFLTTKLDPASRNKLPKMIPVTDPKEIKVRMLVIAHFGTLIHQIISLQYLCTHLLKSTKQLGELYVKNPYHFCRIFAVLDGLCKQIKESITRDRKDLIDAQRSDMNALQLEQQEMLPNLINQLLDTSFTTISRLGARVKDYRDKVAKNLDPNEATYKSVKLEMFEVAGFLAKMYQIDPGMDAPINHKLKEKSMARHHHHRGTEHLHEHRKKLQPLPASTKPTTPAPARPADAANPAANVANPVSAAVANNVNAPSQLDNLSNAIKASMQQNAAENIAGENQAYQHLTSALDEIVNKNKSLAAEPNKSPERQQKVAQSDALCVALLTKLRDFLALNEAHRAEHASAFIQGIHSDVTSKNSRFIDEHHNIGSRALYSLFNVDVLRTDSRKKLMQFDQACADLARVYAKKSVSAKMAG